MDLLEDNYKNNYNNNKNNKINNKNKIIIIIIISDKTLTNNRQNFFEKHDVSAEFHSLHQVKNIREPGEHNLLYRKEKTTT